MSLGHDRRRSHGDGRLFASTMTTRLRIQLVLRAGEKPNEDGAQKQENESHDKKNLGQGC